MSKSVEFFYLEVTFRVASQRKTANWIKKAIETEGGRLAYINYIFCSDQYLYEINSQFLKHKTFTDIITFDLRENPQDPLEAEIYISIPRVKENAKKFGVSLSSEINRVMIHGVLHLLGYKDKSLPEKMLMREKEDSYLSLCDF
jgi:rRNA maturation RNase YbeY